MLDLTSHWVGIAALLIFGVAYALVVLEEQLHLRKSIPVLVGAGVIWVMIGLVYAQYGDTHGAEEAFRHNLLDFAEIFLFLIVAMTYVNTMEERGVFNYLRVWLVNRGFSLRMLFWVTGALAFVISPVADNLTTSLVMGAVVMAMGRDSPKFVAVACINIVVAANAGGAFSPFGDITTLMVWQRGLIPFSGFLPLFLPSLVNWLVPAAIMSMAISATRPTVSREDAQLEHGATTVVLLFISTIAITVLLHSFAHLPPVAGMMFGLGLLKFYSYGLNRLKKQHLDIDEPYDVFAAPSLASQGDGDQQSQDDASVLVIRQPAIGRKPLQIFSILERVEWDTLMFFYGVILGVGALGTVGYLGMLSRAFYDGLGPTAANTLVGILSALIDNVPVMFAVLSMNPNMSEGHWLLVTFTAGVGGSLLSVGSAGGVALMGQSQGRYTFMSHLRWTWAIAVGYAASIATHLLINQHLF
ncbi:MAG: sodium:proton antiporter NhaD [Chloroflexota bacterium]